MDVVAKLKKQLPTGPAPAIAKVGIIGAGQMGNGIAHVVALAGYHVAINDLKQDAVEKAISVIQRNMTRQVSRGLIREADMQSAMKRLTFAPSLEALGDCDLVIEAATEDEAIKRRIFQDMRGKTKKGAILASNTSSISITEIAAVTKRPEKVIGMHFMNPVPVMKLVEVIRGLATSDETARAVSSLSAALGKTPVEVNDYQIGRAHV